MIPRNALLLRLLVLPVVIAGVLAMHALAGGGHAAHPGGGSSLAAAHAPTGPAPAPMDHAAALVAQVPGSQLVVPVDGSLDTSLLTLCLAVLIAGAVVLAPRRTGFSLAGPFLRVLPWTSTARPSRAPPRDLLAQLCVLRT